MRRLFMTAAVVLPLACVPAFAQDATTGTHAMEAATESRTDPVPGTEEALQAEVTESGKVAQEQATNELRLDWITDAMVTAPDGSAIGSINDLILDGETGEMIAAVIGVGGFLGIGEKQIAVPWEQLTVNADAQEITSDLTKEEAEVAPAYVFRDRATDPNASTEGVIDPTDDTTASLGASLDDVELARDEAGAGTEPVSN